MDKELTFHHCMPIGFVSYSELVPGVEMTSRAFRAENRYDDTDHEMEKLETGANLWLEKQVGFYPIFLAYGTTDDDKRMTGYQDNWRRTISSRTENGKNFYEFRKKGEYPNSVLFSFSSVPDAVFMDYQMWFCVLNSSHNNYEMEPGVIKQIFKRSWKPADWKRKAKKDPGSVMAVVPRLDLRMADVVSARNKSTCRKLQDMGFSGVRTARIAVEIDILSRLKP